MEHPYFRANGNYDRYQELLAEWEDLPVTVAKVQAQRRYDEYIKRNIERTTKMTTPTFTIKKRESAPDFVFGSFGCKLEDLKDYVNEKGYVNFDILKSKEGGYYVKVSDYGIKKASVSNSDTQGEVLEFEEMPF